jgi:hypothetical protein
MKENKYSINQYDYTMTDISGKLITVSGADDSVKTVNRSQIIHVDKAIKLKEVKSVGDTTCGSGTEILNDYPRMESFKVKFGEQNENNSYIDTIKAKN